MIIHPYSIKYDLSIFAIYDDPIIVLIAFIYSLRLLKYKVGLSDLSHPEKLF